MVAIKGIKLVYSVLATLYTHHLRSLLMINSPSSLSLRKEGSAHDLDSHIFKNFFVQEYEILLIMTKEDKESQICSLSNDLVNKTISLLIMPKFV